MNFFSSLIAQFVQLFGSQPGGRRLLLFLLVAGSIGGLGWLMLHASTGGYVPVLTQSDLSDTGQALAKLSQLKIPARTIDNGATLLVARNRQDEAVMLLAMEGIFDRGAVGAELLDRNSFGDSNFKQEKNYLRVREGEMARTLMSLTEVESARVHLALPKDDLFITEQAPAKASVVLKLRPGSHLSDRQVGGIVNLVSHGVEGLSPENVSVIDSSGAMLNNNAPSSFANMTAENLTFKTQAEERLRSQVENMLEKTVGKDKVIASVQMDFDFSSRKSIATLFNPQDQDPIVQTEKSTVERQVSAAGADASVGAQTGQNGTQRDDSTKSYAVSQSLQETALTVPTLKRVTVGVMVDGLYDETKGADGKVERAFRTRTPEEMAEMEKVVKAAIGFDSDTRADVVQLSCVSFLIEIQDAGDKPWLTPELRRIVEMVIEWGVVGVIGLLLILLVLKPAVRQITVTPLGGYDALPRGAAGALGHSGSDGGAGAGGDPASKLNQYQRDNRLLQLQESNKLSSESSQRIFREIQSEAKTNPERTVSMIRQWMEEG